MKPLRFERLAVMVMVPPLPEEPELAVRAPPLSRVTEPLNKVMVPPVVAEETLMLAPLGMVREALRSKAWMETVPPVEPEALREANVPLRGLGGEEL